MECKLIKFSSAGVNKKFNEDAVEVYEGENDLLAILCDGIGGDKGGEMAARIAIKAALHFFRASDSSEYLDRIKLALIESNSFVLNHSLNSQSVINMATTMEIFYLKEDFVYWGHIGDSRIYMFKNGRLNLLTKDHSLVQKLLDEGYITQKQAENHSHKNVLIKALGENSIIEPDLSKLRINGSGNVKFLICSDGVTNVLTDNEISKILNNDSLNNIKDQLIKLVKQRGAEDDYSFIIIDKIK